MRLLYLALALLAALPARGQPLTIFAAASLTDALGDVARAWQEAGHVPLRLSFGASSTLARQLDQGAPANLFASADGQWMDWVEARGLIAPGTRRNLLGNSLVLVMPRATARSVTIGPGLDLAALLGAEGRIAVGDPAAVPVGIYARQALTKLGLWPIAERRLARTENVRAALLLVERGEAPLGIVYATDAAAGAGVAVAGVFPPDSHDAIIYPFAITKSGDTPPARALLEFLTGPDARALFGKRGFRPL